MSSPTQISVAQLQRLIGTPSAPIIADVCIDEDFAEHSYLIPCAARIPFTQILDHAPAWQSDHVVVVCQKGLKLSEGAAALLRTAGVRAEFLRGGMLGWQEAGAPLIPASSVPERTNEGHTLWVTRSRPKIDRIACPWLIRRFIDPSAKFLFVSGSQVSAVAERFSAVPFDIDQATLTHRGDQCSFDTMLEHFGLQYEPLQQLADLVRAADTNQLHLNSEAAGLLAVSIGLSRMYPNDNQQLEAGLLIYDALYRWSRDATDEVHDSSLHMTDSARTRNSPPMSDAGSET